MKILAIDTSTMMSSITIMEDDKIIGDFSISQKETHSEMLMVLLKRLLRDLDIKISDIDLFAVCKGPGSFTGLRIGITSIKAICQVYDKPIVGISSLEAMSLSILNDNSIISIIDARGKRFFTGLYHWKDNRLVKEFEEIKTEKELLRLVETSEKVTFVGEAISLLPDEIIENKKVTLAPGSLNNALGRNICVLAKERYENNEVDNYFDLEPTYLRKSQAEINLEKNR